MASAFLTPCLSISLGNIVSFIKSPSFIIVLRSERRYVCTIWKIGNTSIRNIGERGKEAEARIQATMALQQRRAGFMLWSLKSSETSVNFSEKWEREQE